MKTYTVTLEIDDYSNSDGEDLEEVLQRLIDGDLPEGIPSDLEARIVEVDETN